MHLTIKDRGIGIQRLVVMEHVGMFEINAGIAFAALFLRKGVENAYQ